MSGESLGIRCSCGGKTKVVKTRGAEGAIKRIRHCRKCGKKNRRFTTIEHRKDAPQCFIDVRTIRGSRWRMKTLEVTSEKGLIIVMENDKIVMTAIKTPILNVAS